MRYQYLMGLTPNEIHNRLTNSRLKRSDEEIAAIKDLIAAQKRERDNGNRRKAIVAQLWAPILKPLRAEKRKVRACMSYENHENWDNLSHFKEARRQAHAAYWEVLSNLLTRLTTAQRQGLTPKKLRLLLREEQSVIIPNDGRSWVDWVSPKKRARVEALFEAVPHRKHARTMTIFNR